METIREDTVFGEERTLLKNDGRMLVRGAARYWWVMLVVGVVWLLIAWVVLRANATSLATVGVLLGVVLIAAGVNETAVGGFMSGGWRALHIGIGILYLLVGLWAFIRPINTFFALASALGLILVFAGAFEIIRGVASRSENPYWWTGLLSGVLLVLLAFWVSGSDREFQLARSTYLILFWVGFMALLRGITQIMLGFTLRNAGQAVTPRGPSATSDGDISAMVPSQERRQATEPQSVNESGPRP